MAIARVAIELPADTKMVEFERDLAELAKKYGTNLERSGDVRMPILYVMNQMYQRVEANS